jgi:hypothetical protein
MSLNSKWKHYKHYLNNTDIVIILQTMNVIWYSLAKARMKHKKNFLLSIKSVNMNLGLRALGGLWPAGGAARHLELSLERLKIKIKWPFTEIKT